MQALPSTADMCCTVTPANTHRRKLVTGAGSTDDTVSKYCWVIINEEPPVSMRTYLVLVTGDRLWWQLQTGPKGRMGWGGPMLQTDQNTPGC